MTNIKSILKEANRYDEVVDILKTIIVSPNTNHYAVALYYDKDGTVRNDVDAGSVKLEAAILLLCIEDIIDYEHQDLTYLSVYFSDMTNTLLHNYSVSLTHKEEPNTSIDTIRCFSIITNLVDCINGGFMENWTIPDGWKKEYNGILYD